jgi:hypothetical protein
MLISQRRLVRRAGSVADRGRRRDRAHVLRRCAFRLTARETPVHVAKRIPRRRRSRIGQPARGAAAVPRPDVGGVMLRRSEALRAIYPDLEESVVVTIMGAPSRRAAVARPPAELLLPAARDGPRLLGRAGHRPRAAEAACRRARRRRLAADEPGRPHHARAVRRATSCTSCSTTRACCRSAGFRPRPRPAATWPASPGRRRAAHGDRAHARRVPRGVRHGPIPSET